MRHTLIAVALVALVACSSGDDAAPECSDVWIAGADVADVSGSACVVNGEPVVLASATFDCADGATLHMNEYGYWRTDESILHTDWNVAGDYTAEQVAEVCP